MVLAMGASGNAKRSVLYIV